MDFASLTAAATEALGRSPLLGAMDMLTADLNRLRLRPMLVEVTQSTNDLPADFLEAELVTVAGRIYTPATEFNQIPGTYSVQKGAFVFNPVETAPDLHLRYYAKLAPLTVGTNDVLEAYPDLYLYGLLWHHARLVRDESGAVAWGSAWVDARDSAVRDDVASRQGVVPFTPRGRAVV